jgi:hypothetical protein
MNERAPPPERRSICIGGLRHGPDTLGRGRHTEALLKLFATYASVPLGSTGIASGYFFTSDGIFSDKPVPDKVIAVRYHAPSNQIYAELGFSPTTIALPEEDYRKKVADLLIEGAKKIVEKAKKKELDFDGELFLRIVEEVVEQYLALPLPLPVSPAEMDYARFLGIPES